MDKLATLEGRPPEAVFDSVLEAGDDHVSFRVTTAWLEERSLPLTFAGSMLAGVQQLLLASACSVLKPQAHHPRLGRSEAQQFVDAARFRHTQSGSFVLNVSCPVHAMDVQYPLLPEENTDAPFVRRTMLLLYRSLRQLVDAIEADSLDELIARSRVGQGPMISSNLCEALTRLEDSSLRNSVEIGIRWAATLPQPQDARDAVVRIQHDYFARIEDVRRELRSKEQHVEGMFAATVERLDGEMGPDGRRAGEVVLSLLTADSELVRARALLSAEQYAKADQAHMSAGAFVKIAGKLHPGRQPRQLSDITAFELMFK